jgi:hypothetical protein
MLPLRLLVSLAILLLGNRPDEGQWLPRQLREMDWNKLRERGMQLSRDEFWHPEKGGVLSAAVQIGGCSATFVSENGLLVTNHHCGFGAIQQLSSTQVNYLRDGFSANAPGDELRAPGMYVLVVRRIEDVTPKVKAAESNAKTNLERHDLVQREIQRLIGEGQKEPNTVCSVASFFEGREYHLYYRTRIDDVRLVYAPPRSVGEFGGEVDNWEWPRHTGDFAFFRAYVGPDGAPRDYHKDNVPYRPRHWLRISKDGVQTGDLVLIMGYPGRTERYLSADAVLARQHSYWPTRQQLYQQFIAALELAALDSPEHALQLSTRIKTLSNIEKLARGQIRGLERNAVHERKLREEKEFTDWVEASPERKARYGQVLEELRELDSIARETEGKDLVLTELLRPGMLPLLSAIVDAVGHAMATPQDQEVRWPDALKKTLANHQLAAELELVEKPFLSIIIDEMRSRSAFEQLRGTEALVDKRTNTREMVDWLYAQTAMAEARNRIALLEQGKEAILYSDDPLLVVARGIAEEKEAMQQRQRRLNGRRLVVGPRWLEAQQEWRGKSFYPDANSTLRVSIANVTGYSPRDGVIHTPQTSVGGQLQKQRNEEPFLLPDAIVEASKQRRQSRFADKKLGDVPVCFLSNGDTTGGNSGSPVINGKGELVGLNFDRVFEAVSSDYGWSPELSRNISVDIRFVLWFVGEVMPSERLARELGI